MAMRNAAVGAVEDQQSRRVARLDLNRRASLDSVGPIAEDCTCESCSNWSVGALAALFQAREPLAYRLASIHNVFTLVTLLEDLRQQVLYTSTC